MPNSTPSTLLVIEDDSNDVFFLERAIRKTGETISVEVVRTGPQAIEYLSGQANFQDRTRHPLPHLIFLDLHLPGKSGLEVLSWIRSRPELDSIIIVLLTASKVEESIAKAYEIGANSYLVKPATTDSITVLLQALDLYAHDMKPTEQEC